MKLKKSKKGYAALWNVLVAGVIFVALGITLSIGADVTSTVSAGLTGVAKTAADNATNGLANLAKWQPTLGTVIAAGAIISLILSSFVAFAVKRGEGGM